MESADPIEDPDDVAFWWDAGLRVVGPAHFGDNTYIHGTGTEGGLKAPAADLYRAMREAGMILDITHMADQAVWESFKLWDGPVMASHCTCRALVPGQRHPARRHDQGTGPPRRRHRAGVLPVLHGPRCRLGEPPA